MTSTQTEPQTAGSLPKVPLFDRADGSFFRPSPSSTAQHCIEFWSSVAIPDAIIRQVENVYFKTRTNDVKAGVAQRVAEWKASWLQENPKPRFKVDQWEAKFQADYAVIKAQATADLTNVRPMKLGSYDSRQLVRAAQMFYHLPDPERFTNENLAVRDHFIELFNETLTVEQIQMKYKLLQIHHALESVFVDATLTQILQAINDVNSNLSIVSEEVIDARTDSIS